MPDGHSCVCPYENARSLRRRAAQSKTTSSDGIYARTGFQSGVSMPDGTTSPSLTYASWTHLLMALYVRAPDVDETMMPKWRHPEPQA